MNFWLVEPNAAGGWDVRLASVSRQSARRSSRADAEADARHLASQAGGGNVTVLDTAGRTLAQYTVPSASKNASETTPGSGASGVRPTIPAPTVPAATGPSQASAESTDPIQGAVADLLAGYRAALNQARGLDVVESKLVISDVRRSADMARAALNRHPTAAPLASEVAQFVKDVDQEDWIKKVLKVGKHTPWAISVLAGHTITWASIIVSGIGLFIGGLVAGTLMVTYVVSTVAIGPAWVVMSRLIWSIGQGLNQDRNVRGRSPSRDILEHSVSHPEARFFNLVGGHAPRVRSSTAVSTAVGVTGDAFAVILIGCLVVGTAIGIWNHLVRSAQ